MRILGIETSCDETAAAVIENGQKILTNIVASSVELHQKTGGIIPEVAAREQLRYIIPVVEESIKSTMGIKSIKSIDAIAVTVGPGLIGSLLVGVETAKTLAYVWGKPLIPINHLQAHLYANWLKSENKESRGAGSRFTGHSSKNIEPEFPVIGLVVSGGHTDLVLMKNHRQIKWLGGTRDDAAGECFDKCARLLGLGYPGGPAISEAAKKMSLDSARDPELVEGEIGNSKLEIRLPRPMINNDNLDFSFSGLKTSVLNEVKKIQAKKQLNNSIVSQLAYEIQEAITDVLVAKTLRAAKKYQVKSILLAGGVVANPRLREKMQFAISHQLSAIKLFVPAPSLCTDNATFVASCAYFNYHPAPWQKLQADSSLEIEEVIK